MIDINTIFSWFRTGQRPKQWQFQETFSSYWHKSEKLPVSQLTGLDSEDLQTKNDQLLLSDKSFSPTTFSGLGRVYLRKNVLSGKNMLEQFQMNAPDTIYIIQYDYDLNGNTITIPQNSIIQFQGGSISNGTIIGNNTKVEISRGAFKENISFEGSFTNQDIYLDWFLLGDNYTDAIRNALKFYKRCLLSTKLPDTQIYSVVLPILHINNFLIDNINETITIDNNIHINFDRTIFDGKGVIENLFIIEKALYITVGNGEFCNYTGKVFDCTTNNLDTAIVKFDKLRFQNCNTAIVFSDSASTNGGFYGCKFLRCNTCIDVDFDRCYVDNCWITLSRVEQGAIINRNVMIINNLLGVPGGLFDVTKEYRYIDNYGTLFINGSRFGGEGGSCPVVYNFKEGSHYTQYGDWGYNSIVIENSMIYTVGAKYKAAVVLIEMPNLISFKNNGGLIESNNSLVALYEGFDVSKYEPEKFRIHYDYTSFSVQTTTDTNNKLIPDDLSMFVYTWKSTKEDKIIMPEYSVGIKSNQYLKLGELPFSSRVSMLVSVQNYANNEVCTFLFNASMYVTTASFPNQTNLMMLSGRSTRDIQFCYKILDDKVEIYLKSTNAGTTQMTFKVLDNVKFTGDFETYLSESTDLVDLPFSVTINSGTYVTNTSTAGKIGEIAGLGTNHSKKIYYNGTEWVNMDGSSLKVDAKKLLFIDLWNNAAGQYGTYNEGTGLFELNGLTDISYEEAVSIYNNTNYWTIGTLSNRFGINNKVRTNLPLRQSFHGNGAATITNTITESTVAPSIEVLNIASLGSFNFGYVNKIGDNSFILPGCRQVLGPINVLSSDISLITANAFNMPLCEEFTMKLNNYSPSGAASINLRYMTMLQLPSLQYLIDTYVTGKNSITVTLHADAYARLTDDIINAGTAKNITFVSA